MKSSSIFFLYVISFQVYAGVITDGTVGTAIDLAGPNYQIDAPLGTQSGSNLFHSFEEFTLTQGQSATFNGPDSVNNVIGRVTGSTTSHIDGTINSTIDGANLYLINPNGIIFGENAQLDINGSFYASTANQLEFSDGQVFSANPNASHSTLTVAPPSAFGFLSNNYAGIDVYANDLVKNNGQDINLIGGDITIAVENGGQAGIEAQNADLNIVSVGNRGSVVLHNGKPRLGEGQTGGVINIKGSAQLNTNTRNDQSAGNITLQANQVFLSDNATLLSESRGIGNAGEVRVEASFFSMVDLSTIATTSYNSGRAGNISIVADQAVLDGESQLLSTVESNGQGGQITVSTTNKLELLDNATIATSASSNSSGNAGDISITTPILTIVGDGDITEEGSALISSNTLSDSSGTGGNIAIRASEINLSQGATLAVASIGSGIAGNINIFSHPDLEATPVTINSQDSFISARSASAGGGNINFNNIRLMDLQGTEIIASVSGAGTGGNINFSRSGVVVLEESNIKADSDEGNGGQLNIDDVEAFIRAPGSETTARGGEPRLDGQVSIADEVNPAEALNDLSLDFLENKIKDPCSVVIAEEESTFAIKSNTVNCR